MPARAAPRARVRSISAQHRRVQRVVEVRDALVAAVDRERVLGEVVGADAEEVALARERVGDQRRRRHLDHDADRDRRVEGGPRRAQLAPWRPRRSSRARAQLVERRDHRQQQPHVAARRSRAGSRAAARGRRPRGASESRIERQPSCGLSSRSSPRFGIALSPPRSRVRIVTRLRRQRRGHALVELLLLVLLGEAAVRERQQLGAEQTDALGAVALDEPQVGDQPDVRGERDAAAVARLRRARRAARRGARRRARSAAARAGTRRAAARRARGRPRRSPPSTIASSPGWLRSRIPSTPVTAGISSVRAKIAPCEVGPPCSETIAATFSISSSAKCAGSRCRRSRRSRPRRAGCCGAARRAAAPSRAAPRPRRRSPRSRKYGSSIPLEGAPVGRGHVAQRAQRVAGLAHRGLELRDEALVLEDLDVGVEDRRELGTEALAHLVADVVELAPRRLEGAEQVAALLARGRSSARTRRCSRSSGILQAVDRPDRDPARGRDARAPRRSGARRGRPAPARTPDARELGDDPALRPPRSRPTSASSCAFITTGRDQLRAGLEQLDVRARRSGARSTVCTTSTPIVTPRTISGAAISDRKRSSPVSGK